MEEKNKLAFTRKNYILMLIGIGILILGFTIMSLDTEPYGFGFLGLTLGPIVVMIGFIFQFFAILHKSKD
ncbi:MAG: DUF3098 domain-containing protein [Bacteroidota bacterium]|nr:DUF3098 domain-containing protein [Bacteroidota bacterium]